MDGWVGGWSERKRAVGEKNGGRERARGKGWTRRRERAWGRLGSKT